MRDRTIPDRAGRQERMLTQPVSRLIPAMAIPTIIAFLINSIYSLADTFFVSSLGESATAAVSVNANLDQIIMMAGSMLAVGAGSYVSRLLGAGQKDKADKVMSTAFFLAFGFGALILVLGLAFMGPMVDLLGATDTCRGYSMDYASYVLLAAPFMASTFVMNQCLRSEGSAVLSMIGMGFGGVLNCFLDPLFIFGWGPIPAMGVAGASLATAISKLVSFVVLIFPYLTRRSLLRLSIRNFHFSKDIVGEIVSVGSSSMFRSGLAVVAGILLNNIAGDISDAVLAAIGVTTKIMMFPFSIILGFGSGFQPVAGFNWGAKRYDRVMGSYKFASKVALIGGGAMGALLFIFADPITAAFASSDKISPEMLSTCAWCIRLQALALPIHSWVALVNMLCAGLGNAGGALLLSTARQGTCFLPILFPMAYFFGVNGVAAVQSVADVLTLIPAVPLALVMIKRIRLAREEQERLTIEQNGK